MIILSAGAAYNKMKMCVEVLRESTECFLTEWGPLTLRAIVHSAFAACWVLSNLDLMGGNDKMRRRWLVFED